MGKTAADWITAHQYGENRNGLGSSNSSMAWLYESRRLVPWDQQIQLQKYAVSNPEPD